MNYNKVRGILRARQGSQVPKFAAPSGPISYNPNIIGSMTPTPKPDATLIGVYKLHLADVKAGQDYALRLRDLGISDSEAARIVYRDSQNGWGADSSGKWVYKGQSNSGKLRKSIDIMRDKTKLFFLNNPELANSAFNAGLDFLGSKFNDTENSGFVDTAFLIGDTISNGLMMVNPVLGLAGKGIMAAVKGVNSIGGKHARDFSINQSTAEQVGGSYGGSMADITKAASNSGKKYGLFSGSSRRKANRLMNEAERLQNIMTDIANDARDMLAMTGNDFNYLNYDFNLMGGYDLRYMRAAKSGMKIQDKIDFVKLRRTINNIINLDTKEIEWEPETIIFKTGGTIIQDWDIVFELPVKLFEKGGKTKEELETPEIEETSQKNLIPEGALHKNKHHMEHTEGLTLKGIPVIDNDGELLAEIELDEIIFTLEVTKKLEELYKEGTDEAAIEAGKLLVKEILFNTDDRTGLISKCEKGGKL